MSEQIVVQENAIATPDQNIEHIENLNLALENWQVDFVQLQKGKLNSTLQSTQIDSHLLQKMHFNKQIWQRGAAPNQHLNLGILLALTGPIIWNNQPINTDTIEIFSPHEGFDIISPSGFEAYTLSFHETLVNKVVAECDLTFDAEHLLNTHHVFACQPQALEKIKAVGASMLSDAFHQSSSFAQQQTLLDLCHGILTVIDNDSKQTTLCARPPRDRIVRIALSYIEQHLYEPICLSDVCKVAFTSLRTLNRCFQDRYGVAAKEMIIMMRLHAFRHLLITDKQRKIYQVASQCGFWHMGKLGVDYKKLFGELPSQTRKNA